MGDSVPAEGRHSSRRWMTRGRMWGPVSNSYTNPSREFLCDGQTLLAGLIREYEVAA
jgi:hypothetical protein